MSARVLVIAEHPAIARTSSQTLRGEGFDVFVAPDAAEGLRRWATDHADLVIVDGMFSTGDGHALVRQLRDGEEKPAHVPVILLGGEADLESKIRALRAGADE